MVRELVDVRLDEARVHVDPDVRGDLPGQPDRGGRRSRRRSPALEPSPRRGVDPEVALQVQQGQVAHADRRGLLVRAGRRRRRRPRRGRRTRPRRGPRSRLPTTAGSRRTTPRLEVGHHGSQREGTSRAWSAVLQKRTGCPSGPGSRASPRAAGRPLLLEPIDQRPARPSRVTSGMAAAEIHVGSTRSMVSSTLVSWSVSRPASSFRASMKSPGVSWPVVAQAWPPR